MISYLMSEYLLRYSFRTIFLQCWTESLMGFSSALPSRSCMLLKRSCSPRCRRKPGLRTRCPCSFERFCSQGKQWSFVSGHLAKCLVYTLCRLKIYEINDNPVYLERFRMPLTLFSETNPPASSILFFSNKLSGLWSSLKSTVSPWYITHRESPALAT